MAAPLEALKRMRPPVQAQRQPSIWQRGAVPMNATDPTAGPTGWYMPQDRLQQLEGQYQSNSGRRPGGSGMTGLMSGDAHGWSRMLNEQQEYMNLMARVNRKAPPGVETAPIREQHIGTGATAPLGARVTPATGEANDPFGLGGLREGHDQFMERTKRRADARVAGPLAGLKGIR